MDIKNTKLLLGAINKNTGEYVYPKIANKKDEYICPDCNKDLILCQGQIKAYYFRHKTYNNPCYYYDKPSESQIHKDAKLLMKTLLENKTMISFKRTCNECNSNKKYSIPELSKTSKIELEYRFNFNNSLKIADVAYIDNNNIVSLFEICNTHKTRSEDRPEPWFEIDATNLIKSVNNNENLSSLKIPCIRCEKCKTCIDKIKINEIERINRIKQEKIKIIKEKINNIDNIRIKSINNSDYDTADIHRSMRYANQDRNYKLSLTNELILIENDINYILGNNVVLIEHPITKIKIKRSLVNNKTFYKGKWRTNININLLIKWYKSDYDIIDNIIIKSILKKLD